jgi:catechol 2,3-dioxygenase-like lactoylglutathione lyase family enzyme
MSRIFGQIRQNGYVVKDIESAMRYWIEVMGVGPFFYFERMPAHEFYYRGQASPIELSIALANSGNLQIELIQQHNEAPSMYLDFLRKGHEGLHHVAYWTENFDADLARLKSTGYEIGQHGGVSDGRFAYFLAENHPGSVIELSEISGRKGKFFKRIAEAAGVWDGSEPIRKR